MTIGTRVLRISGGPGYQGMVGTVIEVGNDRLRVRWDDQTFPNPCDPTRGMVTRKGKRTWVKPSVVRIVEVA